LNLQSKSAAKIKPVVCGRGAGFDERNTSCASPSHWHEACACAVESLQTLNHSPVVQILLALSKRSRRAPYGSDYWPYRLHTLETPGPIFPLFFEIGHLHVLKSEFKDVPDQKCKTSDLKKVRKRAKSGFLRSVWPAVRPLSRAAGCGAKAPPLAARAAWHEVMIQLEKQTFKTAFSISVVKILQT